MGDDIEVHPTWGEDDANMGTAAIELEAPKWTCTRIALVHERAASLRAQVSLE